MNFFVALVVWIIIAAFLAAGVVMAVVKATAGSFIFLAIVLFVFIAGFIKFGCLSH